MEYQLEGFPVRITWVWLRKVRGWHLSWNCLWNIRHSIGIIWNTQGRPGWSLTLGHPRITDGIWNHRNGYNCLGWVYRAQREEGPGGSTWGRGWEHLGVGREGVGKDTKEQKEKQESVSQRFREEWYKEERSTVPHASERLCKMGTEKSHDLACRVGRKPHWSLCLNEVSNWLGSGNLLGSRED